MSTRRGACPSLHEPMATGDGLLVRLSPADTGWTPAELSALAGAAARFGNGILEVTTRGNLQIRGLTEDSATGLAAYVEAAAIPLRAGLPIDAGPLAGIDAEEIADPLPLAKALHQAIETSGLTARLAPKVSVVIDGGGALTMDEIIADIRLKADAEAPGCWRIAIGGNVRTARMLGLVDAGRMVGTTLDLLEAIAAKGKAARGRDLSNQDVAKWPADLPALLFGGKMPSEVRRTGGLPVGRFTLKNARLAAGFVLPFGQVDADTLAAFCAVAAVCGASEIRLSPGRGLIVPGLDGEACAALELEAAALGFITDVTDPRLSIAACAGGPFCASAHLATRALGAEIARTAPELVERRTLHISGCEKRCAEPAAPDITILGTAGGCLVLPGSGRDTQPVPAVAPEEAPAALRQLVGGELKQESRLADTPQPAES